MDKPRDGEGVTNPLTIMRVDEPEIYIVNLCCMIPATG